MLNEKFVQEIAQQAVKAAGPVHFQVDAEASDVYFIRDADGNYDRREANPMPRANLAGSLQPFPMFAKQWPNCEIWYSRDAVTMILDEKERRERVTLGLCLSPQLQKLQQLNRSIKLSQAEFVLLLRTDLANCFDGDLLATVRSIRFTQQVSGSGEIRQGKTSIGRDVQEEVTGANAIPEVVEFNVPIWENGSIPYRRKIACALVVDTASQNFCLIPLANAIEEAISGAERQLGETLEEMVNAPPIVDAKGEFRVVPIYYGSAE